VSLSRGAASSATLSYVGLAVPPLTETPNPPVETPGGKPGMARAFGEGCFDRVA